MFNVKKWYLLPFKKICSIEFFEKIELERYNLCLELYKLYTKINQRKRKISVVIFTYVTTFPDYQWISSQISNQLARGHRTIGNCLKSIWDKSVQFVYPNSISFTGYIKNNIDIKYRTKRVNGTTYIEFIALSILSKLGNQLQKTFILLPFLQVCEDRWYVHYTIIQFC